MSAPQGGQDTLERPGEEQVDPKEQDRRFLRSGKRPECGTAAGQTTGLVDIFSGCGGLTYGALEGLRRLNRSGELSLAIDLDSQPLEVFAETLGLDEERFKEQDLGLLGEVGSDETDEEAALLEGVGDDSLLLAGPPCQGHSALNNHTRHDDSRNDLYMAVARIAELTGPKAIIAENVSGVGSDRKEAVKRCAAALVHLGYEVKEKRLDLRTVGVPQRRIRHVLVATDGKEFDWDELGSESTRDVAWAISDLLDRKPETQLDTPSEANKRNRERIAWLFDEGEYDLPNDERPTCHKDNDHSYVSMYGRLRWDKPAQTITSGFGSMGQGRFVHPRRRRTLTPHEAARLQCLPDFVAFDSVQMTRSALATMIGNVAPPFLAMRVVQALVAQDLL